MLKCKHKQTLIKHKFDSHKINPSKNYMHHKYILPMNRHLNHIQSLHLTGVSSFSMYSEWDIYS